MFPKLLLEVILIFPEVSLFFWHPRINIFILLFYQSRQQYITFTRMESNHHPNTPSLLFSKHPCIQSINSPFISPLRLIHSPSFNDWTSKNNQSLDDLNSFQLEDPIPSQNPQQQSEHNSESQHEQQSLECPSAPEINLQNLTNQMQQIEQYRNLLKHVLNNANKNPIVLQQTRKKLEEHGSDIIRKLFEYLVNKFKKLKKTKEEMVKYCIRKSFKYITHKMRESNPQTYINMENNQVVTAYFQLHNEGDSSISIPFKKNSELKTMNSSFLKKIFKCRQFNLDYRQFLKQFPRQFNLDNGKKVKNFTDAIKQCIKQKCIKGLDEYKRLPWTQDLLQKMFEFAKKLMENSPYSQEKLRKQKDNFMAKSKKTIEKKQFRKNTKTEEEDDDEDEFQIIRAAPKKSVGLETLSFNCLQSQCSILDIDIL